MHDALSMQEVQACAGRRIGQEKTIQGVSMAFHPTKKPKWGNALSACRSRAVQCIPALASL